MIVAQISDTHLTVGEPETAQRNADFRAVIADINTLDPAPDVIVHTGDIVQNGRAEEYAEAAAILSAAKAPVYVMAGNKDDRAALRAAFGDRGYLGQGPFVDYAVEGHDFRLLMLDTVNPASKKGDFCAERFARLRRLAGDPEPTLVFMHHPPFEVLVGPERFHYDDLGLMARLAAAVEGAGQVAAVFCGHVHRPTSGNVGAVPAVVAPSVAIDIRFGAYPPHMATRPVYFVHRFEPSGAFTTETQIAGRWF